jgi:hypothetical protein
MALTKTLGGGGGATIAFQEEGAAVVSASTFNVVGAGGTVTDVGGVATLTLPNVGAGSAIRCRVRKSTNTNPLSSGALTALTFNTEVTDTDSMYDAGSPSRITINTAGTYHVSGAFGTTGAVTAAQTLICIVRLNGVGSGTSIAAANVAPANQFSYAVASTVYDLAATDYLELCYFSSVTTFTLEGAVGSQVLSATKLA